MATLKDLVKKMKKIKDDSEHQIEKIQDKAKADQKKNFSAAVKLIFKENPELKSFSWTQYTPHWNDGDECTFEANIDYIYINDMEDYLCADVLKEKLQNIKNKKKVKASLEKELVEAKKNKDRKWEIEHLNNKIKELDEDPKELETLYRITNAAYMVLKCCNNDMFEFMFGDHVKVTVTANSIKTEEYEHE